MMIVVVVVVGSGFDLGFLGLLVWICDFGGC